MRASRLGASFCLWVAWSVASVSAQSPVQWQTNIENARQLAAQSNRLVLIHFWTEACPPCMRMEREVFSRPDVADAIHASYVPVRVNVQKLPNVARQYGVSAWPTDIILSPRGDVIERKSGAADAPQYVALLNQIAARAGVYSPPASNAQPPSPPVYGYNHQSFGAPSGSVTPPNFRSPNSTAPQSSAGSTFDSVGFNGADQPSAGVGAPSGMRQPAAVGSQPWQPEIAQWNRGPAPTPVATPNGVQPAGPYPQQGGYSSASNFPRPSDARYNHPAGGTIQSPPLASGVPNSAEGMQSAGQSDPPPLALDGYCPVTLLEQERWVRGDPRYGVIHRGRTYLFVGAEEAKRFFSDPERYAPVLSGIDVVVAVEENRQVPGKREHGAWYEGRMYLFSSEASFRKFDLEPSRYAAAASQVAQASPRGYPGRPNSVAGRDGAP